MPDELGLKIGFDSREFRKGIEQTSKDVDAFVRKTLSKQAGAVQSLPGAALNVMAGLAAGGPIQRGLAGAISGDPLIRRGIFTGPASLHQATSLAALGIGVGAVGGAGRLYAAAFQAGSDRAAYVREQGEIARRTRRPVGELTYGSVSRQDVQDIAMYDERRARAFRAIGRTTAPFRQNLFGFASNLGADIGNVVSGRTRIEDQFPGAGLATAGLSFAAQGALDLNRAYNAALYRVATGEDQPTRAVQRERDFQMAQQERRMEAIRQANRDDALVWEIR